MVKVNGVYTMRGACRICEHWNQTGTYVQAGELDTLIGQCRRRAPEAYEDGSPKWPRTLQDSWCGDYAETMVYIDGRWQPRDKGDNSQ